jgi:hypothetical protein
MRLKVHQGVQSNKKNYRVVVSKKIYYGDKTKSVYFIGIKAYLYCKYINEEIYSKIWEITKLI